MDLTNKVCLITGANSGIGKVTAIELAKNQVQIIMLCRNEEKAKQAREEIYKLSGNSEIDYFICDLSSQQQIHETAEKFRNKYKRLDILINNAGLILSNEREETEDGYEKTFAVNYLSHYTLTLLLLDLLKSSTIGRIISVSSEAHRYARYNMEDLQLKEQKYSGLNAYCLSKLCLVWFTRILAEKTSNVTANCLHPGFVASNFGNNTSATIKAILALSRPFAISNEKGAETSVYLATSGEVTNITGKYFKNKQAISPSKDALDDEKANKCWELSAHLTKLDIHKVTIV